MSQEKKVANTKLLSKEQQVHLDGLTSVSSKIRYLYTITQDRAEIARQLGIRYQWVRNVLITPLKKEVK